MQLVIQQEASKNYAKPDFIKDAWYAVEWDIDVKSVLLSRTICNKPLLMYRTRDGRRLFWRMRAGIACSRSRRAGSKEMTSSAVITG